MFVGCFVCEAGSLVPLDAEHSEISRSPEISRDLDSFFLARPRDFEIKYLALVSNSEMFRQKSRSRLEL